MRTLLPLQKDGPNTHLGFLSLSMLFFETLTNLNIFFLFLPRLLKGLPLLYCMCPNGLHHYNQDVLVARRLMRSFFVQAHIGLAIWLSPLFSQIILAACLSLKRFAIVRSYLSRKDCGYLYCL